MNLDQAITRIRNAFSRMDENYRRQVFDEFALVEIEGGQEVILHYQGPRPEGFKEEFAETVATLRQYLAEGRMEPGDFEFSREGAGRAADGVLMAGPGVYVICNNTAKSMEEITQAPLWTTAQEHFVNLSDLFREQPLDETSV